MLNYSIVMRGVNANLLQINQAKSRINKAKKDGVQPAQEDLNLVATEVLNAFAIAQYADVMNIERFARHIASHGCVYSRADISAILYLAVDCTREMLLEGKKVRLGDLGDFYVTLSSKGAESADKFTAQHITAVKVNWNPGMEFTNLIQDAEFNLVASRSAQEALIKATKKGETTVDLSKGEEKTEGQKPGQTGGSTQNGGNTPSGGNTQTGGNQTGGGTVTPPAGGDDNSLGD